MRIVYIINVDWFFLSHWLPLAIEAKNRGLKVYVIAGNTGVGKDLENYDINFIPWKISRSGINLFNEILSFHSLIKIVKYIKPDIIHNIGIKSLLYGSLASIIYKIPLINSLAGLGFVFSKTRKANFIKFLILPFFKRIFKLENSKLIVQNKDDFSFFLSNKFCSKRKLILIRGSGIDLNHFILSKEPKNDSFIVALPSRMLWDKGIGEFIEAISIIKRKYSNLNAIFVLIGGLDINNPSNIRESQILDWEKKGLIKWMGYQSDMVSTLSSINLVVLPSYNEGLPKVLLEAASIGRAIITTDAPGCRELIKHNVNGLLVPIKDSISLASAISELIINEPLRQRIIKNGYEIVKKEYSIQKIVKLTFDVYSELLNIQF